MMQVEMFSTETDDSLASGSIRCRVLGGVVSFTCNLKRRRVTISFSQASRHHSATARSKQRSHPSVWLPTLFAVIMEASL